MKKLIVINVVLMLILGFLVYTCVALKNTPEQFPHGQNNGPGIGTSQEKENNIQGQIPSDKNIEDQDFFDTQSPYVEETTRETAATQPCTTIPPQTESFATEPSITETPATASKLPDNMTEKG